MRETDIRVGVVGAGANTTGKHIPLLQQIEGVEIAGVVNRSEASSRKVAQHFGIPKVYRDWEEAVEDSDTNAMVIGTWPNMHCPVTRSTLKAGKHVLTEARMAMNVAEARSMLAASRSRPELVAQVVPSPITLFADVTIVRLLKEDWLGELLAIESRIQGGFLDDSASMHWRQDVDLSGLNILAMGIYYEAIMRWAGCAKTVVARGKIFTQARADESGQMKRVRVPEHLDVIADMECGAQLHMQQSAVTALMEDTGIYLFGAKGTLRVDSGRLFGGQEGNDKLEEISIAPGEHGGWQVEEDFVAAIRGQRKVTHTTFEDGVRYMEFTEAVARSRQSGQLEEIDNQL